MRIFCKDYLSNGAVEILEEPQNKITLSLLNVLKLKQYILFLNVRIPEYRIYHYLFT